MNPYVTSNAAVSGLKTLPQSTAPIMACKAYEIQERRPAAVLLADAPPHEFRARGGHAHWLVDPSDGS